MKIVHVDGLPFIAGLLWQTFTGPSANKDYKLNLKNEGDDLSCRRVLPSYLHGSNSMQIGSGKFIELDSSTVKSVSKLESFAAAMAEYQSGSWIGAFQVDDFYCAVIINNSTILSTGDIVFDTFEELEIFVNSQRSIGGWDYLYSYNVDLEDFIEIDIAEHLKSTHRKIFKIKKESNSFFGVINLGGLSQVQIAQIVLIAGVGIYYLYDNFSVDGKKSLSNAQVQSSQDAPVVLPWTIKQDPLVLVNECVDKIKMVRSFIDGWALGFVTCDASLLQASYEKKYNFSNGAMLNAGGVINVNNAIITTQIALLDKTTKSPQKDDNIRFLFADEIERAGGQVNIRGVAANLPGNQNEKPNNWIEYQFDAKLPDIRANLSWFNNFSGLYVNKIEYKPNDNFPISYSGQIFILK